MAAARAAHADEFIDELPDGYDTIIGERGYDLSGGQRQRIAIARTLLANPPILVLDDATSAVDVQVEEHIHDALRALLSGRTTLVIAHRLSTISLADRVVLIEGGRVVADGTHVELMATEPRYVEVLARAEHETGDDDTEIATLDRARRDRGRLMAWGGARGGFGGPSAVSSSAAAGLPFAGVPPELADRVEAILETEPEHPRADVPFTQVEEKTAPFTLRRFLATRKPAMAGAFALVLVETLDDAGRSAADPARASTRASSPSRHRCSSSLRCSTRSASSSA